MVYDLSKEIDEMLGVIEAPVEEPTGNLSPKVDGEPPIEEPPVVEEPIEVPPVEEPPVEEPPVEEPLVVEPEVPPVEEEPSEETTEELLERVRKLTERVEELTNLEPGAPTPTPVVAPVPKEEPPVVEAPPVVEEAAIVDFLEGAGVDDVLDNKEALNKLLNKVLTQATGVAQKKVYERVLLSIPDLVLGHINRQSVVTKMVSDFYEVNEDLIPVKKTVGAIANTVHAEHPDWQLEEVFKESAVRTRDVLGLRKKVGKKEIPNLESPAFAKVGGGKTVKKAGTALQDEINDLLT